MVQPAGEVGFTSPTQGASIHRAAEVTSAQLPKMTSAQPAAAVASAPSRRECKRLGRNCYGGNDDRDSVQHKFLHGSFRSY
jgi:hypothetical protein